MLVALLVDEKMRENEITVRGKTHPLDKKTRTLKGIHSLVAIFVCKNVSNSFKK